MSTCEYILDDGKPCGEELEKYCQLHSAEIKAWKKEKANKKTCLWVLSHGPHMGEKCGRYVLEGLYCDLCHSRMELIRDLSQVKDQEGQCKNSKDPYNGEVCDRSAVFNGYCLLCLSNE